MALSELSVLELEQEALRRLLDRICQEGRIAPEWSADYPGVEVAVRRQGDLKRYFVMNHSAAPANIQPPEGSMDLLTNQLLPASIELAAGDVLVFAPANGG